MNGRRSISAFKVLSGEIGYHFSRNPRTWGCVRPDGVVEIDKEREILQATGSIGIQGSQGPSSIPGPFAEVYDERELPATEENHPPDKHNQTR